MFSPLRSQYAKLSSITYTSTPTFLEFVREYAHCLRVADAGSTHLVSTTHEQTVGMRLFEMF